MDVGRYAIVLGFVILDRLLNPKLSLCCSSHSEMCTEWPAGLETDEQCEKHFPLEVESRDYLFSGPSMRHPEARVVTIRVGILLSK